MDTYKIELKIYFESLEKEEENVIDRCDLDYDDYSDEEWYTP